VFCTIAVHIGLSSTWINSAGFPGVPPQAQELKGFRGRLSLLTVTAEEDDMAHIDWLVNRDGVMFAPDVPREPEDYAEADKARREPGDTDRSNEHENDPEEMEVGDPRDGP
jgi:hypothetical protein